MKPYSIPRPQRVITNDEPQLACEVATGGLLWIRSLKCNINRSLFSTRKYMIRVKLRALPHCQLSNGTLLGECMANCLTTKHVQFSSVTGGTGASEAKKKLKIVPPLEMAHPPWNVTLCSSNDINSVSWWCSMYQWYWSTLAQAMTCCLAASRF